MNVKEYWEDIDTRLEKLIDVGYVKLPSLSEYDLDFLASDISNEMGTSTFKELGLNHKKFLDDFEFQKYLTPKLHKIAKEAFNYKGDLSNQYHVARKVEPGNSKEMFRAHFDSHIFTIVLPIKIPETSDEGTSGDLIYFPYARKVPSNEITNYIGKAYYKKYASKGYALESCLLVIKYLLKKKVVNSIESGAKKENLKMINLMKNLNMKKVSKQNSKITTYVISKLK